MLQPANFQHSSALNWDRFKFVDLFAGIGGLRRGFEACGGKCVWTSEIDKFANITYNANFSDSHKIWSDLTTAHPQDDVPDHDVLLAGFPCQPFSIAGVSKKNSLGMAHGFLDLTQGTLFFVLARIIAAKQPNIFLLENVKNLLNHDKGKTFSTITKVLKDELGYNIHTKVINSENWVPQNRKRIYIVGFRENVSFSWDQIKIPSSFPKLEEILHAPDEQPEKPYTEKIDKTTIVSDRYTLSDKTWDFLQKYAKKHAALGNGFGCSVVGPKNISRTLSARYYKDGSEILISQGFEKNPRKLTPRECSRLMGFDTRDTPAEKLMKIPVCNTRAYEQFGNSVVVPVIKEIARAVISAAKSQGTRQNII